MLNLFLPLDRQLQRGWSAVLSLLAGWTGRSNLFFARLFAIVGIGGLCVTLLVNTILSQSEFPAEEDVFFTGLVILGVLYLLICGVETLLFADQIESRSELDDGLFPLPLRRTKEVIKRRLWWTAWAVLCIALGGLITFTCFLVAAGSHYFLTDIRPPRKSKFGQLVRRAKEQLGRVRVPVTNPAPHPT